MSENSVAELDIYRLFLKVPAKIITFKEEYKGKFDLLINDKQISFVDKNNTSIPLKKVEFIEVENPDPEIVRIAKEGIHQEYHPIVSHFFLGRFFMRPVVIALYMRKFLTGVFTGEFPYSIMLKDGNIYTLVFKHAIKVIALEEAYSTLLHQVMRPSRTLWVKSWIPKKAWRKEINTKKLRFLMVRGFPTLVHLKEGETFGGTIGAISPHFIGFKAYKYRNPSSSERERYIIMRHAINGVSVKRKVPPRKK